MATDAHTTATPPPATGPTGVSGVAVVALVFGVLASMLGCPFTFFALPIPIVGIILGFYALGKPNSRGVAIGAIITSFIGLITIIVVGLTVGSLWWVAAREDTLDPAEHRGGDVAEPAAEPGALPPGGTTGGGDEQGEFGLGEPAPGDEPTD